MDQEVNKNSEFMIETNAYYFFISFKSKTTFQQRRILGHLIISSNGQQRGNKSVKKI